ncbi:MAG: glycosyltransferase, partial [Gammaproteobacteria bacterium]|nr:glycosyltransferase [Gammaproteobacteria bacterium]
RREGLPKTIIEAMACGVVPVVTDTGGNAELVVHRESGLVVAAGDELALAGAIQELCNDVGLRRKLAAAARQRIGTHFNINDTVSKTMELFHTLLRPDL